MRSPYSAIGDLHISLGNPWISAEQDPHFAALQFHLTARSDARLAWTHSTASRTTIPSRTGTEYEISSPPPASPRQIRSSSSEICIIRVPPACTARRRAAPPQPDRQAVVDAVAA